MDRCRPGVVDAISVITPAQQMLASCTGAFITSLLMTPLDVVKTRLQAQQRSRLNHRCFLYCNGLMDHVCLCVNGGGASAACNGNGSGCNGAGARVWHRRPCPTPYRGTCDAMLRIARVEGVPSLWSGLLPTLVSAVPTTVLYFTGYDRLRMRMLSWASVERWHLHSLVPLAAGAVARLLSSTLMAPLELVRTRVQAAAGRQPLGTICRQLVGERGVVGLWRGLVPTLMRDIPFSAIYWFGYETLKRRFLHLSAVEGHHHQQQQRIPALVCSFVAGACAGSLAAVVTLPFDVVKTHWQIELGGGANGGRVGGVAAALSDIYRRSGVRGLFAGLSPRLVKVAPACAIMITTYETGKVVFAEYNTYSAEERLSSVLMSKLS